MPLLDLKKKDKSTSDHTILINKPNYLNNPEFYKNKINNFLVDAFANRKFFNSFEIWNNPYLKTIDFFFNKERSNIRQKVVGDKQTYANAKKIVFEILNLKNKEKHKSTRQLPKDSQFEIVIEWLSYKPEKDYEVLVKVFEWIDGLINRIVRSEFESLEYFPNSYYLSAVLKVDFKLPVKKKQKTSFLLILHPICKTISNFYEFDYDCTPEDIFYKFIFVANASAMYFKYSICYNFEDAKILNKNFCNKLDLYLKDQYLHFIKILASQIEFLFSQYLRKRLLLKNEYLKNKEEYLQKIKEEDFKFHLTWIVLKLFHRSMSLIVNIWAINNKEKKPFEIYSLDYDKIYKKVREKYFEAKTDDTILKEDYEYQLNSLDFKLIELSSETKEKFYKEELIENENLLHRIINENPNSEDYFKEHISQLLFIKLLRTSIMELVYFPLKFKMKTETSKTT